MCDNNFQSTIVKVTDTSVMPAVTAQAQSFLMNNATAEPKEVCKDGLVSQHNMHSQYVLQLLRLQREAGFLCDITIHVKDRSFKAHKPLLAACSLYFRSLFSDPNTKDSTALNLVPLTPTGFEVLLDYIYSGNLAITADNCSAVLSAAICLQMTNVVETCKKFMQSSFQMSNSKEPSLPAYQKDKNFIEHNVAQSGLWKSNSNTGLGSNFQEDHTLSGPGKTQTMESDSRQVSANPSATDDIHHLENSGLPSTSQLQSVLPILMSSYPRQPTPKEVQIMLSSIPNAAELLAKYPSLSSSVKNLNQALSSQKPKTEHNVNISSQYLPVKLSTSTNHFQNGLVSKSIAMYSDASSAKDFSTTSSAVPFLKTTEHGSGYAPTINKILDYKNSKMNRSKSNKTLPQQSLEENSNSIEISSDEESERIAWSVDRSVLESSDLSGTPCKATTQNRFSRDGEHNSLPVNLSNPLPQQTVESQKNPVMKTLSLPSLSETTPVKPLSRARSAENSNQSSDIPTDSNKHYSNTDIQRDFISQRTIKIEPDEARTVLLSDRLSASELASDTLSPLNEQLAESESSRNSADCMGDDNMALDLSVPTTVDLNKHLAETLNIVRRSESESHAKNSSRRSSATSSFSDPGMQLAVDALEMLKQSKAKESGLSIATDVQSVSAVSSDSNSTDMQEHQREGIGWDDENIGIISVGSLNVSAKPSMFSRKPRRTTDGQMCTYPGCKQLFRHRNMYEEHMRMHKRGAPAAQLRKCYMGARVKKTVREQLEELRTNDSVFDGTGDADASKYRAKKRKSTSDSQEPLRKRVNVKDRIQHIQFAAASHAPPPPIVRKPLHQVLHPLSKSPTSQEAAPTFLRPPALLSSYASVSKSQHDTRNEGLARLGQVNDAAASPTISQPPRLSIAGSPYSLAPNVGRSPAGGTSTFNRMHLGNSHHVQGVNPINATLALLGIQTPLRSTNLSMTPSFVPSTVTSPINLPQRRTSASEAIATEIKTEPLFQPSVVLTPLPAPGSENVSAGEDVATKDGFRLGSDASSASSGSPPTWSNNPDPSATLNR